MSRLVLFVEIRYFIFQSIITIPCRYACRLAGYIINTAHRVSSCVVFIERFCRRNCLVMAFRVWANFAKISTHIILAFDDIKQMNGVGVNAYVIGLVYAINNGHKLKNCSLCKYSGSSFYQDFYCCMSRKYGTPHVPDRQSDATKCQYYSPYHRMALINRIIPKITIAKIENVKTQETE